jgi:3-oxoacyl-[acyl-carrier protein] reductase
VSVNFEFTGRTVLVTGAAQGIGFAIASLFARSGASVVALDRDEGALDKSFGDQRDMLRIGVDVADTDAVRETISRVVAWGPSGSVDVLVNNAGIVRDGVVWKLTDADWHDVLAVHLTGTFATTRAAIPYMRAAGYGRVVNVTSYSGLHGNFGQANYAAAKAGILGFSRTVAKEVARFGITVNAVSPNAATAMVRGVPPEKYAELEAATPIGRFADAAEIAPAVAFLASEEAGYVTGAMLPVDGGLSI